MRNLLKSFLTVLIRLYAYAISPLTGAKCRFYPTCSAYALEAIGAHGAAKGLALAVWRILRCHPWHRGDMIDPVPASIAWRDIIGYKREHCSGPESCGCAHKQKEE